MSERTNRKPTISEIESRMTVKPNRQHGIQNYDVDNAYPQRIEKAIDASGRTKQCLDVYFDFIRGMGFKEPFHKVIVNEKKKLTVDKLLRKVIRDFSIHEAFYIHLNFNALGEIVSMDHVPFKEFRLGIENEETGLPEVSKHHRDWTKESGQPFDSKKITEFNFFNPSAIKDEVIRLGGLDKSNGQVYYFSVAEMKYPKASCDPVLEDVVADDQSKQFRLNNISSNFLASHILEINECENDEEREAIDEQLVKFQGGKNGGKIFMMEKKGTETTFNLQKLDPPKMDGLYEHTETSVKESIRSRYKIPPVLVGDLVAGKMGTAQEIQDATLFYNTVTADKRMIFEEVFTELFKYWHQPNANPDNDFSITPLTFGQDSILVERLGVGGTQALQAVLVDTTLEPEQKKEILIQVFGILEENAIKMVGNKKPAPQPKPGEAA